MISDFDFGNESTRFGFLLESDNPDWKYEDKDYGYTGRDYTQNIEPSVELWMMEL